MSISRLLHEFRPLFRMLEEPLTRGTSMHYGFPSRPFFLDPLPNTAHPALDLTDEGSNYLVEAELPGVKKENIDITVSDGGRSVTIQSKTVSRRPGDSSSDSTAETGSAQGEAGPNQLTAERLYSGVSSFTRTVWLPCPVDSSNITAKLADGVLTLRAPKAEDKESIRITVD